MIRTVSKFGILILCCLPAGGARADFIKMPDLTEMPELERKSLLKDLDIPGVRDRDPSPDAGPRLNVSKFKLEGIVEFPELGITREDIEELIENIRFDLMEEYKILESGFTENEIGEVTRLLTEIEEETQDSHVTDLEVQKLVWLVREQRSRRGVTLGQIEAVADRITDFYRGRGFILAKAYIPRQQVRDGIVTLTLLLGSLGEVDAEGNSIYREPELTSVFDEWLTKPVSSVVVEENLYLINDFPGIAVNGFFEPGSQVGDTRLTLNVVDENRFETSVRVDNHGSVETGESRVYGEFSANNLAGHADQLQFAALYAFDPQNTDYYKLKYSSRAANPRLDLAAGISTNDFVIGAGNQESFEDLDLSGSTRQADITATYSIKRSRTSSMYGIFSYENIESRLRVGFSRGDGDLGLDDKVDNYRFTFSFDLLTEEIRTLHQGDLSLLSGSFDEGAEPGQDEDYFILGSNYSLLTFWQLPFIDTQARLIYRASLQLADSPLSSINQFALAGPSRVRAYASNQFFADVSFYTGADLVFRAPDLLDLSIAGINLKSITRPFVFVDFAWGEALSLDDDLDDVDGQLLGAGIGLQFSYSDKFQGNFQVAFPLEEDFGSEDIEVEDDGARLIFDFQYGFR